MSAMVWHNSSSKRKTTKGAVYTFFKPVPEEAIFFTRSSNPIFFNMTEPDPDEILKSLDAELAISRMRRKPIGGNRNAMRIFSIVLLLILAIGGLALLQYMVSELHDRAAEAGKLHTEKPAASAAAH